MVKGGYHSLSHYQWYLNNTRLCDEYYPIIYANQCGVYKCEVRVKDTSTKEFAFTVKGELV